VVVGEAADELVRRNRELLSEIARSFNASPDLLPERLQALRAQLKETERERDRLRDQLQKARLGGGDGISIKHGKVAYVTETVDASNLDELAGYADRYLEFVKSGVVTVVSGEMFVIKVSKDLTSQFDANRLKDLLGKGGKQPPHFARGKLAVPVDEAFRRLGAELS
jgi:alanyl-tRNA synthetase